MCITDDKWIEELISLLKEEAISTTKAAEITAYTHFFHSCQGEYNDQEAILQGEPRDLLNR